QAEDGIRDLYVTGVQTCALPIFAVAAQGAPQAKPDPSHETQSAVADYNAGDYRAALVQFHDAAERGDRLAQFNYAMMLLTGEGRSEERRVGKEGRAGWARDG